jgi:hypothetical protein
MRGIWRVGRGLCPGYRESGGKRMSARTRKANRYVKRAMCQRRGPLRTPVPLVEVASQNGQCRFCCLGLGIKLLLLVGIAQMGQIWAPQADPACVA